MRKRHNIPTQLDAEDTAGSVQAVDIVDERGHLGPRTDDETDSVADEDGVGVATDVDGSSGIGADAAVEGGYDEAPDPPELTADASELTTESIVEAMLFASDSPITPLRIAQILGAGGVGEVRKHVAALNVRYGQTGASFRIEEIAKGYQMMTLPQYNVWVGQLLKVRRETKLSQASLETLAVVAYRQPAMRVEIEEIRGVGAGVILQKLREMNLVKIVGRAEEIGRPLLYGTTKRFLEVFGLASLDDLPKVEELVPPEKQARVYTPVPEQETLAVPADVDGEAAL
ncbi:MAG: SMC-Scp complex subunit ScpB [Phycisphaerales bacterium]|nr:SMC-Scp complex subunit ScpB [Phycisphaerales bacterium]